MKIKSKALLAALCAVLLVGATMFGTLAYLTAKTEEVKNTFTVGTLAALELKEHLAEDTDRDGVFALTDTTTSETDNGNDYIVLPGVDIPKDPFVTVTGIDVPAYLFIEVVEDLGEVEEGEDPKTLPSAISYGVNSNWSETRLVGPNGGKVYTYGTTGVVSEDIAADTPAYILTGNDANPNGVVTVAADFKPDGFTGFNLSFYAYLCQQGGFANAEDAWTENFVSTTPENE